MSTASHEAMLSQGEDSSAGVIHRLTVEQMAQRIEELERALEPLASLPIGPEIIEDVDLVLYKNAGRAITVGDILSARAALASANSRED